MITYTVRLPSVCRLSIHIYWLLRNRDFDETWHEAISFKMSYIPSLRFSGWSENKDGRPGLWLAETCFTLLQTLGGFRQNLTGRWKILFGCHYIFCYIIFIIYALRVSIFMTSPLGWLLVCCLYKEVYLHFLNVCPFDNTTLVGSGKVGLVNQVNHTSWVNWPFLVHPQSLCNRFFFLWRCLCCHFALLTFLLV